MKQGQLSNVLLPEDDPSLYLGPSMKDISAKQKQKQTSNRNVDTGKDVDIKARLDKLKEDSKCYLFKSDRQQYKFVEL